MTKIKKDSITFLLQDKSENLWFGAMYYLAVFNMNTGRSSLFYPDTIPFNKLDEYEINDIYADHMNFLWIATARGLCRINIRTGEHTRYLNSPLKQGSLSDNIPWRLHEDSLGRLWVLCYATGLNLFNPSDETFIRVNPFKSTRNISFLDMIADARGNLWILHSAGLSEFNPLDSSTARLFELPQMLPYFKMSMLKRGDVIISPVSEAGGTYRFHPERIESNRYIAPTWITNLMVNNVQIFNVLSLQNNYPSQNLVLNHKQNFVSFEFVTLNYTESEKNEYKYIMHGVDPDTIYSGTRRFAEYPNLRPGTYTFWVTGSNNDGVWNPRGTSVLIQIRPPWHQTKLALLGYLVLFIASISVYIRLRTIRLERDKNVLEGQVRERTKQIEDQKHEIEVQKEQIIGLDELKTRFFTNVSHEFRTPLTLIATPLEELLEDVNTSELQRSGLNLIKQNSKRLLNLVNQLLDIAKIDNEKMILELVEADVIDFLRTLSASFSSLAEVRKINYSYHLPINTRLTWFDPDKLEKILVNLISNAFKFTPEGGKITLTADYAQNDTRQGEFLEFSVSDTGTGIPPEAIDKIFDRFYQLDGHVRVESGGTGIGLALCKDLINLMHGEIVVTSKVGEGSVFTVRIPLGKDHLNEKEYLIIKDIPVHPMEKREELDYTEQEKASETSEGMAFAGKAKPLVLVVEDNKDIRMHISEHLKAEYNLLEANDGKAGLNVAIAEIPDLIITDLMMPHLNGIDLCKQLKTDERTSHIPIIMLTARVSMEDKLKGLETGADDYVIKPFEMKELKARVANLIGQRKKLRERFSHEHILQPHAIAITTADGNFLTRALENIERHMNDSAYGAEEFQADMNMSRSSLSRKVHALTNQSPLEFIRLVRLKRAAELLKKGYGNVSEVALEVGFSNPSYFAKWFKAAFGVSPHEYPKG